MGGTVATLDAASPSHTFDNLAVGHVYSIMEISSDPDYDVTYSGVTGSDGYSLIDGEMKRGYFETVTNTYNRTAFTVKKVWSDGQAGHNPIQVTMHNTFNDGVTPPETDTQTLDEGNGWQYTFTGLKTGGNITVEELNPINGYLIVYGTLEGDGLGGYLQTIRNQRDQGSITVLKHWQGDSRASEVRPAEVRVQLFYREKGFGQSWQPFVNPAEGILELSAANGWEGTQDVWLHDNGLELEYSAREIAYKPYGASDFIASDPPYTVGYTLPVYSVNGGRETNTRSAAVDYNGYAYGEVALRSVYTTTFTVTKQWVHPSPAGDTAGLAVTVELQRDGVAVPGQTAVLSEASPTHTFAGLETGHTYAAVEVEKPENYADSYSTVEGEDGYALVSTGRQRGYSQTVTNTHEKGRIVPAPGDDTQTLPVVLAACGFTALACWLAVKRRQLRRER